MSVFHICLDITLIILMFILGKLYGEEKYLKIFNNKLINKNLFVVDDDIYLIKNLSKEAREKYGE